MAAQALSGIINAKVPAHMKPHAILINIARSDVVDEAALVDALAMGLRALANPDDLAQGRSPRAVRS
ncbi:NAD(P)-dependent oxidoreductase [Novosphingobium sediminicola]|uniref:Phosphoglycerate dehydrogenase-like enzyme n=1 Tax=Novosphingobium sediminicola TaxID=563162 RepID=A0A7W6G859_9SPHN|nr:NAD(P)-dependent oxidoreductase [Novosphingobium sediminicola]MBB3955692.1 phosphoglycerate dehydrogenase-like enzyme [Novosphingobium sediminicola]